MDNGEIDKIFDDFKDKFKQFIDHTVDEKIEPIRALLMKEVTPKPKVGQLVDATAVAELLGFDLSTPETKRTARQKVYYLARTNTIPSIRLGRRRIKFDLEHVKRTLDPESFHHLLPNNEQIELTSALQP